MYFLLYTAYFEIKVDIENTLINVFFECSIKFDFIEKITRVSSTESEMLEINFTIHARRVHLRF